MKKVSVLFVCMGNICRSPTAHGVFEQLVTNAKLNNRIEVESAGTHSYHIGEKPDPRSMQVASQHGYDLSYIRSRKVKQSDFEDYDYVIAMDKNNLENLSHDCPDEMQHKLHLFLEISDQAENLGNSEVPDPYYGGANGFQYVLDIVEQGSKNLLNKIKAELD